MSIVCNIGKEFQDLRAKLTSTILFIDADNNAAKNGLNEEDVTAIRALAEGLKGVSVDEELLRRASTAIGKLVHSLGDSHDFLKSFDAINAVLGKIKAVAQSV